MDLLRCGCLSNKTPANLVPEIVLDINIILSLIRMRFHCNETREERNKNGRRNNGSGRRGEERREKRRREGEEEKRRRRGVEEEKKGASESG